MDVSIIIVNYNTKELIANCIQSIYEKTVGIDYEIIVVDNDSIDGSQQMIAEKYPTIKLIQLNKNIGFGRANNEGVKIATGRNILFLNPDTILINNAIVILSDFMNNNPQAGACGGNLLDEDFNPTHSYRLILPSIFYEINELSMGILVKLFFGKNTEYNFSNNIKKVAQIVGADLMIKRTVLDEVGYFNPIFFMYFEETDLCYRINRTDYRINSVPYAKIQHLEGKSLGNEIINTKRIELFEKSRKKYYTTHFSKRYCKTANLIYLTNIKLRIFVQGLLNHKSVSFWKKTLEQYNSL